MNYEAMKRDLSSVLSLDYVIMRRDLSSVLSSRKRWFVFKNFMAAKRTAKNTEAAIMIVRFLFRQIFLQLNCKYMIVPS